MESGDVVTGLRLPVQWVNRPNQDFRGFAGTLAAGEVRPGDAVVVLPSARRSTIAQVLGPDGPVERAFAGQAVTLTLTDEIDISRGDVIAAAGDPPAVADQFAAHLLWMSDAPLLPGRPYWLKIGTRTVAASVSEIKHRIDVNTQNTWPPSAWSSTRSATATSAWKSPSPSPRTRKTARWAASS